MSVALGFVGCALVMSRLYIWSLSPNNFNGSNANVFRVNSNGNLNNNNVNNAGAVASSYLLRLDYSNVTESHRHKCL